MSVELFGIFESNSREQLAFSDRRNTDLYWATLPNIITTAYSYCARNSCLNVTPRYASSAIAQENMCTSKEVKKKLCEKIWPSMYRSMFLLSRLLEIERRNTEKYRGEPSVTIGRGADSNLESSLRLNLVFITSFLYSSGFFFAYYSYRVIGVYILFLSMVRSLVFGQFMNLLLPILGNKSKLNYFRK